MTVKEEVLKYLEDRDNFIKNSDSCTFEATIRITNLPNIEDKQLLMQTLYDWLYNTLAFDVEEHVVEHHLEDAGIELEDFRYLDWEIDDEVCLQTIGNN